MVRNEVEARDTADSAAGFERKALWPWLSLVVAMLVRIVCVLMGAPLLLGRRVEIATPVNSLIRLAEGYWLKQIGISSYAGSAYHGSPLLLAVLGPLTTGRGRTGGYPVLEHTASLVCVCTDFLSSLLLAGIGRRLQSAQLKQLSLLNLTKLLHARGSTKLSVGDTVMLFYAWNPFTIVSCIGGCTSSIENFMIILGLYGAVTGNSPLAAFGWTMAAHLSLYPAILFIPIALSLACGIDHPPMKLFKAAISSKGGACHLSASDCNEEMLITEAAIFHAYPYHFRGKYLRDFFIWSLVWWVYIIWLCRLAVGRHGLSEMFSETYGFILTVEDLSPNLGVFWYFFTEVFDFFRPFFLLVFHANILFMIVPIAIRLHHRPIFLAFIFIAISAMLKSYPSIGDAALYLGLMPLFMYEISGMRFTFFLLNGYIGISFLSLVMYNLWIWRGTGNANFYFATALAYACIQLILIVETLSTVFLFDRNLRKLKDINSKA
eukprot:c25796_g1_i1 orf=393-1865(+)